MANHTYTYPRHDPLRRNPQYGIGPSDRNHCPRYGGRPDPNYDAEAYRHYNLPIAIHDVDLDNSPGQRRRIQVACARCRRRKIKCSGNPGNGSGCQACRSSGADINACTFERVGTTHKYDVDMNACNPQPTAFTTSCGTAGSAANLAIDDGCRPISTYSQQLNPSYDCTNYNLDMYAFELENAVSTSAVADSRFSEDHIWPSRHSMYTNGYPVSSYDNLAPLKSHPPLAPLDLSNTSSQPPPIERRLPAPNFVGSPISPDVLTSPISMSGRLAGLSLGGNTRGAPNSYTGCNGRHSVDNYSASRQNSIQDMSNDSVILPPFPRALEWKVTQSLPNEIQQYSYQGSSTDAPYACASSVDPSPFPTSLPPMLPSSTSELRPSQSNSDRHSAIPLATSAPSIPAMVIPDSPPLRHSQAAQPLDKLAHSWSTANDAHRRPTIATHDDGAGKLPLRFQPIAPSEQPTKLPNHEPTMTKGKQRADSVHQHHSMASGHRQGQSAVKDLSNFQRKIVSRSGASNL